MEMGCIVGETIEVCQVAPLAIRWRCPPVAMLWPCAASRLSRCGSSPTEQGVGRPRSEIGQDGHAAGLKQGPAPPPSSFRTMATVETHCIANM